MQNSGSSSRLFLFLGNTPFIDTNDNYNVELKTTQNLHDPAPCALTSQLA